MSLCIARMAPNGHLLIAGDSRVSAPDQDGNMHRTGKDFAKLQMLADDKLVFVSGLRYVFDRIISEFKASGMQSAYDLAGILQRHNDAIPKAISKDRKLLTALMYVCVENGRMAAYVICNVFRDARGNCIPYPVEMNRDTSVYLGATSKELENAFAKYQKSVSTTDGLKAAICKAYDFAEGEEVGGTLTIYEYGNKGVVSKSKYPIADAESLELKGLRIVNDAGQSTFTIDKNGHVTLFGGSIDWNNVNSDPATKDAAALARNALNEAMYASSDAAEAARIAKQIADGKYTRGTFLNGREIYSPTILSNHFKVIPTEEGQDVGGYSLSYYGPRLLEMLKIDYFAGDAPCVNFGSGCGAYATWDFGATYFHGNLDFSGARVTGLEATFA